MYITVKIHSQNREFGVCVCVCVAKTCGQSELCDTRCARLRKRPSWGVGSEELGGASGYCYI